MAKFYQLVAWTEKGQVKMIPSLVAELAQPYLERIKAVEAEKKQWEETAQTDQLLRLSRAYEALGQFYLRVGYRQEAYRQFEEAADLILGCSTDILWKDSEWGYRLVSVLANRVRELRGLIPSPDSA